MHATISVEKLSDHMLVAFKVMKSRCAGYVVRFDKKDNIFFEIF